MAYRSKFDKNGMCWKQGAEAEESFFRTAKKEGYEVVKGTIAQDRRHIDYIITKDGITSTVEVKSRKRVKRGGNVQSNLIWIEFFNVAGKKGWRDSEVDFVAFELDNDFIIVKTKELLELSKNKIDMNTFVDKSSDALYKSYRRKDRPKEHIGLIKIEDIMSLEHKLWKKIIRL
jgi:Holliday junction resolvase